jgi:hypothetical protein
VYMQSVSLVKTSQFSKGCAKSVKAYARPLGAAPLSLFTNCLEVLFSDTQRHRGHGKKA